VTLTDQAAVVRMRVRRSIRRRRRPLAAGLAALAVLASLSALRPSAEVASARQAIEPAVTIQPGEVSVPITLGLPGLTRVLELGQVIDVVAVSDDSRARIVSSGARVIEVPDGGGGLAGSTSAVVVLAVDANAALPLVAAAATETLAVIIRDSLKGH
jgi:hypothetical protein